MATMKLSNEAVMAATNDIINQIKDLRSKNEAIKLKRAIRDFNSKDSIWVFKREWRVHLKVFAPILLFVTLFYPFVSISRAYTVYRKPVTNNPRDMVDWLNSLEDNDFRLYLAYSLEDYSDSAKYESISKLKCMAENNEDDFMTITREEAVELGVC